MRLRTGGGAKGGHTHQCHEGQGVGVKEATPPRLTPERAGAELRQEATSQPREGWGKRQGGGAKKRPHPQAEALKQLGRGGAKRAGHAPGPTHGGGERGEGGAKGSSHTHKHYHRHRSDHTHGKGVWPDKATPPSSHPVGARTQTGGARGAGHTPKGEEPRELQLHPYRYPRSGPHPKGVAKPHPWGRAHH